MKELSSDVDTQKISAHLASLKTKIVTLITEAEKGITTVEVCIIYFDKVVLYLYCF